MMKSLLNYLKELSTNKEELINYITQSNFAPLLNSYLEKLDYSAFLQSKCNIIIQKKRNKVFLNEIKKIQNSVNNKDIKICYLKGLFLASMLFEDYNIRRSTDIDILINISDLDDIISILTDHKFRFVNKCTSIDEHHLVFNKVINDVSVVIEIHGSVNNPPHLFKIDEESILNRAEKKNILDCNIWLLEMNDNILYLISHFFIHLNDNLKSYFLYEKKNYEYLCKLIDIALLIDKYKDYIEWEVIKNRAKEWKMEWEVNFTFLLINEVFGLDLPIIDRINEMELNQLFFCNLFRSMDLSKKDNLKKFMLFDVKRYLTNSIQKSDNTLYCSMDGIVIDNLVIANSNINYTAKIKTDHLGIYIYREAVCSDICFRHYERDSWFLDNIDFMTVYGEEYTFKEYSIGMYIEENKTKILLRDLKYDKELQDEVKYVCKINDNGYNISLDIEWAHLGITPEQDIEFGFNMSFIHWIIDEGRYKIIYDQWGKDKNNISQMGSLIIK